MESINTWRVAMTPHGRSAWSEPFALLGCSRRASRTSVPIMIDIWRMPLKKDGLCPRRRQPYRGEERLDQLGSRSRHVPDEQLCFGGDCGLAPTPAVYGGSARFPGRGYAVASNRLDFRGTPSQWDGSLARGRAEEVEPGRLRQFSNHARKRRAFRVLLRRALPRAGFHDEALSAPGAIGPT
jgi:hypothetical protein